ncbi:MAG: tRNA (adenosine(37)-N6)-threonylcarbamoyltransferase complex transferase subunit TsaD [candidate division Zixibacteria bacterium]|nr:tRNA (adenosine(37)-N6)-threonylcarbamoyltransferase complex transferase subunit TsaD [candidate division Zixibacteria bacterium]
MLVLGIETSCDETAVAVVRDGREILSNVILSQAEHSYFGGVVPEIASRAHLRMLVPVYRQSFEESGVTLDEIGLIAATMGPGLVGPLLVGLTFAKGLAFAARKPFIPVHHVEGHIAANCLLHPELDERHLTLVVSGGHTMLVEVRSFGEFNVLGQTRDDAAGEAFDKVAKLMGLGYPGGAHLEKLAQDGDPGYVRFPRAMKNEPGYNFSYSGLKTAVALHLKRLSHEELESHKADIAASFQEAAVEVLVEKTTRAACELDVSHVTISGGVAANSRLREWLTRSLADCGRRLFFPSTPLCTDNGAMIAAAGYYRYRRDGPGELVANAVPYLKLNGK